MSEGGLRPRSPDLKVIERNQQYDGAGNDSRQEGQAKYRALGYFLVLE
jgi:hypothetical protein